MVIIPGATQASQLIQELQSLAQAAGHTQPLLIGLELESGLVRRTILKIPLTSAFIPCLSSKSSVNRFSLCKLGDVLYQMNLGQGLSQWPA